MSAVIHHGNNNWRDRGKPRKYRTDPTCKGKQRYVDEVSVRAAGVLSILERRNTDRLWCYRCRHCMGWHLTSGNEGRRWRITLADPGGAS